MSHKPGESIVCTGKIKHKGSTYIKEWNYLKSRLPADRVKEAKLTLPAPEWYHLRYQPGYAYSKEYEIERFYRDALLMCIGEGTNEMQRMIIAKQWVKRNPA